MNIYGIGIDIVKISRFSKLIKKKSYLKRIFSKKEIQKCSKKKITFYSCFAKRFAAKEAFSKALGTGISNGISLNEIIVKNNISGKPYFNFEGDTKRLLKKKFKNKEIKTSLSLSDENKYAVAFVTISL